VGGANGVIVQSSAVRDLGIFIDADLSMSTRVQQLSRAALLFCDSFAAFGRLSVPFTVSQTLVVALVLSKLDLLFLTVYSAVFSMFSMPAARLAASLRRSDHITDTGSRASQA